MRVLKLNNVISKVGDPSWPGYISEGMIDNISSSQNKKGQRFVALLSSCYSYPLMSNFFEDVQFVFYRNR